MSTSRNLANFSTIVGGLIGELKMWPTATPPSGYLTCDGSAISRTTYADLFAAIGTAFGSGNGTTTFNLPDYRDNMPIGSGNLYNINSKGGSKDAIVVSHSHGITDPTHGHGVSDPGHFHTVPTGTYTGSQPGYVGGSSVNYLGAASTSTVGTGISISGAATNISVNSAGASANNANLPPYVGIHFIIRYQ